MSRESLGKRGIHNVFSDETVRTKLKSLFPVYYYLSNGVGFVFCGYREHSETVMLGQQKVSYFRAWPSPWALT